MKTIKLKNGVKVPLFGLGTFKVETGQSGVDVVLNALKVGYRHIDTAKVYLNEEEVGQAIKLSKIPRDQIFITTKQKELYNGNVSKIKADIEDSFRKLQVDYIDLLLIHWPHHDFEINNIAWKVFEEYYQSGRIKAIGVSNFQIHHLDRLMSSATIMPMVNQVELHPGLSQVPLVKYCTEKNIVVTSYGPFMKGGVYSGTYKDELEAIANNYDATVAQIVIAWGLKRNIIMIPKSEKVERLIENFKGQNIELSELDVQKINFLNKGTRVYTDPDNHPFLP